MLKILSCFFMLEYSRIGKKVRKEEPLASLCSKFKNYINSLENT